MEENRKALYILLKSPVNNEMIEFLTSVTSKVIRTIPENGIPTPPPTPDEYYKSEYEELFIPPLRIFIANLVRYTNVYTETLLATVVYLSRLRKILPSDATGIPSTVHRIFLACLIISAKYHNDSSPLNRHWTEYTDGLFCLEDVNLMERQLLQLLDWDLRITEKELIIDLKELIDPIKKKINGSRFVEDEIDVSSNSTDEELFSDNGGDSSVSPGSATTLIDSADLGKFSQVKDFRGINDGVDNWSGYDKVNEVNDITGSTRSLESIIDRYRSG